VPPLDPEDAAAAEAAAEAAAKEDTATPAGAEEGAAELAADAVAAAGTAVAEEPAAAEPATTGEAAATGEPATAGVAGEPATADVAGDLPPTEGAAGSAPPPGPPPGAPPRGPAGGPPPRPPKPPGLREQARRTFEAGRSLVNAHIVLARAELATIAADLKVVAAQVGIAIALLLYILLLVPVGTALFLGEWLFGSIGWGILHGALFSVAVAVAFVLGALRIRRTYLVGTLFVAVLIGIAVGTVFGLAWPNAAYAAIGDNLASTVDPAYRPLLVGVAVWGAVLALLGIIGGARAGGVGGALGGFLGGAIVGALFGAFTAISFSLQVGIAIGVSVTLVAWPMLAALALRGYDWENLQRRFVPQASIDAAMETRAFVEARLPGRKGGEEDAA
jgi:hypothetical protein